MSKDGLARQTAKLSKQSWALQLTHDQQLELRTNLWRLVMVTYWHDCEAYCDVCSEMTHCHLRVMRLSTGIELADIACNRCRNAFGDQLATRLIFAKQHGSISDALKAGELFSDPEDEMRTALKSHGVRPERPVAPVAHLSRATLRHKPDAKPQTKLGPGQRIVRLLRRWLG